VNNVPHVFISDVVADEYLARESKNVLRGANNASPKRYKVKSIHRNNSVFKEY
jgi:hypothetical protein